MPSHLYQIPNLVDTRLSSFENSVLECDSNYSSILNNTIVCDDTQECGYDNTNLTGVNNGYVSCTAYLGCTKASDINVNNGDIRCDGLDSCHDIVDTVEINGMGNGSIYLAGYLHDVNTVYTIRSNKEKGNNIICTGINACRYKIIESSYNLYCNGYLSCISATIYDISNNVGYLAANGVRYISGSVYCNARETCVYIDSINNVAGDVYATGYKSLFSVTFEQMSQEM